MPEGTARKGQSEQVVCTLCCFGSHLLVLSDVALASIIGCGSSLVIGVSEFGPSVNP